MSAKSNFSENALLRAIFLNEPISGFLESGQSQFLYVALHTDNPSESGTQSTNEANYQGYQRIAVPRNSIGWTVTDNTVRPTVNLEFPECTGGTNMITHFSIGFTPFPTSPILYYGQLQPFGSLVEEGVIIRIKNTSTLVEN